ncbi:MAG: flagellar hook-length control protein FliK [Pikeienuella sp.]
MIPLESFTRPPNAQHTAAPAPEAEPEAISAGSEISTVEAAGEFALALAFSDPKADQTPLTETAQHAKELPPAPVPLLPKSTVSNSAVSKTGQTIAQSAGPLPLLPDQSALTEPGADHLTEGQLLAANEDPMPATSPPSGNVPGDAEEAIATATQGTRETDEDTANSINATIASSPPQPSATTDQAMETPLLTEKGIQVSGQLQSAIFSLPAKAKPGYPNSPADRTTEGEPRLAAKTITAFHTTQNTVGLAPKATPVSHPAFGGPTANTTKGLMRHAELPELAPHIAEGGNFRQTTVGAPQQPSLTPTDARSVVLQVAAQIVKVDAGKLDIRLDPPELGRVSVTLSTGDDSISAVVAAERPETHDLLRRHADMLQRALRDAGYADVTLNFSDTTAEQQNGDSAFQQKFGGSSAEPTSPDTTAHSVNLSLNGLDIRL